MASYGLQRWLDQSPEEEIATPVVIAAQKRARQDLVEQQFPTHHLKEGLLSGFLKAKFPQRKIQIAIHEDDYVFHVPRTLSA
jgi:hypothetical protein